MKTKELIKLAVEILEMNDLNYALTGSLMLFIRDHSLTRAPVDIDLVGMISGDPTDLKLPPGFIYKQTEGLGSEVDAITFFNEELDVKVDFLYGDEEFEYIFFRGYTIPCGQLEALIDAKLQYYHHDVYEPSAQKHYEDLCALISYMSIRQLEIFHKPREVRKSSTVYSIKINEDGKD